MVNVRIQLAGLPQSTINVERGIHVHEFGDIGDMCSRVGPHFNPTGTPHGRRLNFAWYVYRVSQKKCNPVSIPYNYNSVQPIEKFYKPVFRYNGGAYLCKITA